MSVNTRILNKFHYHLEDFDCIYCSNYGGLKAGCQLDKCCCLEEKLEAAMLGRISRPKGWFNDWDL